MVLIKKEEKMKKPIFVLLGIFVILFLSMLANFVFWRNKDTKAVPPEEPNEVVSNTPSQVTFPAGGENFVKGKEYSLRWNPESSGEDTIAIFLIDASLESQGASVSIADRIYDVPNTGSYDYTFPESLEEGSYKFQIGKENSNYFKVVSTLPGEKITVKGEVICLPHKNAGGFVTMECAFGLKGDDGKNYGLKYTDPESPFMIDTGKRFEVAGNMVPDEKGVYDVVGNIEVEAVTPLSEK